MELLKVGDRVQKRSGPTGRVTEIDGDTAVVPVGRPASRRSDTVGTNTTTTAACSG